MLDLTTLTARRICVIKPSALGDVVQALPLLEALRARFPASQISWVINRELADLISGHPLIHDLLIFDRHGSWTQTLGLLRSLRRGRFDLVIDLQGLLRTGAMTLATGAPTRVGLETAREGASLACHLVLPETSREIPAHARYWKVAEALGIDTPRGSAHIPASLTDFTVAQKLLAPLRANSTGVLAVHAGAKWETKRWPAEKFAEVAVRAATRLRVGIAVVGSSSEHPLAAQIADAVISAGGVAANLAGTTNLKQLAAVLKSADVVLSNDSGPMHLAAEQETRVVGLFTCTNALRSGPPGPQHRLISTTVPCAGEYHKICPHAGGARHACFDALDLERVWQAVRSQFGALADDTRYAVESPAA